jgi:hypothetical protein
MAPPLINELLDKAILEVKVLENAADATRQEIEQILASAEQLTHTATSKGENCQGALSLLTQTAFRFHEQIQHLLRPWTFTALQGVETAAATVSERAKALWVQARGRAEDLEQQRARLETELEANRQATRTSFEHVGQTVQALGAAVAQQTAAAHTAIDTLRQGVVDSRAALNAAKGRFLQALQDAEEVVESEVDSYQDSIHSLRTLQTEGLIGLANTMVDAHNITVHDVRQRLVEELPAEIWRAVGSLHEGLDELHTIHQNAEAPLDRATAAVVAVVKKAKDALVTVREFADQAKQL